MLSSASPQGILGGSRRQNTLVPLGSVFKCSFKSNSHVGKSLREECDSLHMPVLKQFTSRHLFSFSRISSGAIFSIGKQKSEKTHKGKEKENEEY